MLYSEKIKMKNTTFGMIKPEGIKYREDIEERIRRILEIEEEREVTLTDEQFERLYDHARPAIPNTYGAMKEYMLSSPVIILRVTGEDAIRKLLELRGCSNAADAMPGTIRGDYAKDQDYRVLYGQGKFAMNVFHAADAEDAQVMVDIFFGSKE